MSYSFLILTVIYLADSGMHQGVKIESAKGAEVAIHKVLQSATYNANHGNMQVAAVKKIAIDMLATNVLHFGPTYSKTVKENYKFFRETGSLNLKVIFEICLSSFTSNNLKSLCS